MRVFFLWTCTLPQQEGTATATVAVTVSGEFVPSVYTCPGFENVGVSEERESTACLLYAAVLRYKADKLAYSALLLTSQYDFTCRGVCLGVRCDSTNILNHRSLIAAGSTNRWGCMNRLITVPYTASSATTTIDLIGGLPPEERHIPFFFVGTARNRPERENLEVKKTTNFSICRLVLIHLVSLFGIWFFPLEIM